MVQELLEHKRLDNPWTDRTWPGMMSMLIGLRMAALQFGLQECKVYLDTTVEKQRVYICENTGCNGELKYDGNYRYQCTKCLHGYCRHPKHKPFWAWTNKDGSCGECERHDRLAGVQQ